MGRSVSYPSEALVVTFAEMEDPECSRCEGTGRYIDDHVDEECDTCEGRGKVPFDSDNFDDLIDAFRSRLKELFPSVEDADQWLDNEDHILAENKLARFGMSEYCGLVAYWIVPQTLGVYDPLNYGMTERWIKSIADKFVAAFGELSKVGSMSNGEGVYQRIDR